MAELYLYAMERLDEAGLAQYEISNFARAGRGVPPQPPLLDAAASTSASASARIRSSGSERFANTRNIREYIADPERAATFEEHLGEAKRRRETHLPQAPPERRA